MRTVRTSPPDQSGVKVSRHDWPSARLALSAAALLYGFFAAFRTVGDTDLGWHLATGKWIVSHHRIPSVDVLSFTAVGREWIYPILSQICFYLTYQVGGYALISWMVALACVLNVAIVLRKGNLVTAALAVLAVPLIATRIQPRAEMFTELLFAGFVSILWVFHRTGRGPLWLLPVLMCVWVNLHLGFPAGLAMCAAYLVLESTDMLQADRRSAAMNRVKNAVPWLVAAAAATLLNPWGYRVFIALARQQELNRVHSRWITEWYPVRITTETLVGSMDAVDPHSAVMWMIAIAIGAVFIAAYKRQFGAAIVLALATAMFLRAIRLEGVFAAIVVIIGGSVLFDALGPLVVRRNARPILMAVAVALCGLAGLRMFDLASNRYYLRTPETFSTFGAGESAWYPREAAEFVLRQKLPKQILNDFNSGGFDVWALYPEYPDYIDGRSVPFGPELFARNLRLLSQPPDSDDWSKEAARYGLNTALLSLDHEMGQVSSAYNYCNSKAWRAVYLDPNGIVLIRVAPENAKWIAESGVDCNSVRFDDPAAMRGLKSEAAKFRYHLNAASILIVLDRTGDALAQLEAAQQIFDHSPYLHYARGAVAQRTEYFALAESEFKASLQYGFMDDTALALTRLYRNEGRNADAEGVLKKAIGLSRSPFWAYAELGEVQVALNRKQEAIRSFQSALKESPFTDEYGPERVAFEARIRRGIAEAGH